LANFITSSKVISAVPQRHFEAEASAVRCAAPFAIIPLAASFLVLGQGDDIPHGLGRLHVEPLLGLGLCGESLVMRVNHRRGIAGLWCGEILVAVQGKVIGAKRMAQPIRFTRDSCLLA
jgi:hypothetical protein